MSIRTKLAVSVLVVMALLLGVNSAITIQQNHAQALDTAHRQNQALLQRDASRIELALAGVAPGDIEYGHHLRQAGGQITAQSGQALALYHGGAALYTSLPAGLVHTAGETAAGQTGGAPTLVQAGGQHYMLLATPLATPQGGTTLLCAYNITPLYAARSGQLTRGLWLNALTLAAAAAAAFGLASALTRPLRKLQQTSRAIAAGQYSLRTGIRGGGEIGSLSASFDEMAAAVEEKIQAMAGTLQRQEEFVAAFTHEVKTPMTAMMGYAALLRKSPQPPEKQFEAADFIYLETRRLEELSTKLLGLLELKDGDIALEAVDVPALFGQMKRTLPGVQFESSEGLAVTADKTLLDDLLRNLATNALRAVQGVENGRVEIRCQAENGRALFTVEDNGCGIPPEALPHITESFYMVDKSRARRGGGSGLGLALAARIAALHGTQLTFASAPEEGTTVQFTLECARRPE